MLSSHTHIFIHIIIHRPSISTSAVHIQLDYGLRLSDSLCFLPFLWSLFVLCLADTKALIHKGYSRKIAHISKSEYASVFKKRFLSRVLAVKQGQGH